MSTNQSQEESRPGILGEHILYYGKLSFTLQHNSGGFASSILNVIQPLVTRHQGQPYQHAPAQQGTARILSPGSSVDSGPSAPTKEREPSRSIPGRWNSVDFAEVAIISRDVAEVRPIPTDVAGHATAMQNELDHSVQPAADTSQSEIGSPRHKLAYNNSNKLLDGNKIAFPEPHIPRVEVTTEPRLDTQQTLNPGPFSSDVDSVFKIPSRPSSSFGQVDEDDAATNKGPLANLPQQSDLTQAPLLKAPLVNNNNRSQDRLSVSSIGDISAHSPGKKGFKHLWDSAKSRLKPQPTNPPKSRSDSPSATPPGRTRTSVAFQKQEKTIELLDTKIEYFQNVEIHSSTTWEDICNELIPLPAFGQILSHLHRVFGAVDNIRTYRGQWRRLRGNCVVTSRVLVHQYERYQTEPEKLKLLGKVCESLEMVIAEISMTARKWSEKNPVEAFVSYESVEKALNTHFLALSDVLKMMVSTSQVLNETWASEIAKSQKEERQELQLIHSLLQEQNGSLAQLAHAIQSKDDLIAKLIGENEVTIGQVLGQQMARFQQSRGDAEDTDKLIQMIIEITGVELPTEVFQTESCTNEPDGEPIHGRSSTVYKAKLARGQLVAKKVFYLNKYSEGDVKTYAMKMTRDAKQWRLFDSEYTLRCLGIGMERSNDTQFKLYMLSPWMENMDALKYLKDRRENIDRRNILRIVADSALGLVEIHQKNSVHSNMRGQNVFVRANGRGVLGGFGLTKALKNHATGKLPSVEQTGQSLPYRWMAPECHHFGPGRPDVTIANDVWGWAMTALEIVTGAPPIRRIKGDMALPCATTEDFDAAKQRHEYPEWEKYAYKPDLLWSLLSRCWNLDETKRPDMKTVSNEIENIISQR
ncbi:unnamed protein product [Rhizoctonia solani]|uniref:Protein kinase domain-containing protein n=1 Tax=Rhizoctonia solani TaxID=456999 RepID=A0A8H3BK91_9AGAM|nr:unnamed protein product [Rhizoctonia solani]